MTSFEIIVSQVRTVFSSTAENLAISLLNFCFILVENILEKILNIIIMNLINCQRIQNVFTKFRNNLITLRFLLIRRRAAFTDPTTRLRRRHNRGPPAFGRRGDMTSTDGGAVWTTTSNIYPPPSYDAINDFQSTHMSTPPPYDSAAIIKTKPLVDDPTSSSTTSASAPTISDPNELRSVVNTSFSMDEDLQVPSSRHQNHQNHQQTQQQTTRPVISANEQTGSTLKAD